MGKLQMITGFRFGYWAVALVCLYCSGATAAEKSLEELATQADEIIVGKVQGKKVRVVGGRFETEYGIEIGESWKGTKMAPGEVTSVTLVGGTSTTPPLMQVATGQPYMFVGEEVALFLNTKPRKLRPETQKSLKGVSTLGTTPWVVGSQQGKFTVITDTTDNKKKIARISMESFGVLHDDNSLKLATEAAAAHKIRVTSGTIVAASPPPATKRDPLEMTKPANNSILKANAAGGIQALQAAQHGSGIVTQDFQDFKNQVLDLTGKSK